MNFLAIFYSLCVCYLFLGISYGMMFSSKELQELMEPANRKLISKQLICEEFTTKEHLPEKIERVLVEDHRALLVLIPQKGELDKKTLGDVLKEGCEEFIQRSNQFGFRYGAKDNSLTNNEEAYIENTLKIAKDITLCNCCPHSCENLVKILFSPLLIKHTFCITLQQKMSNCTIT